MASYIIVATRTVLFPNDERIVTIMDQPKIAYFSISSETIYKEASGTGVNFELLWT
jgi:hypothetical protein